MVKKLYRLLCFGRPFRRYLPKYFVVATLSMIFSMVNFSLLIPMLDILFSEDIPVLTAFPKLALNFEFFKALFNYYFALLIGTYGKISALIFICGILVFANFLANAFKYWSLRTIASLRATVNYNIRKSLYEKVSMLDLGYFNQQRKGELLSISTNDVNEVQAMVGALYQVVLREPVTLIGYLGLLIYLSPELTAFSVLVIPVMFFFISRITRKLRKQSNTAQLILGQMMSILDETVSGIKIIKAFGARKFVNRKFNDENENYKRVFKKMNYRGDLAHPVSEFLGIFSVAILVLFGSILVLQENSTFRSSELITYLVVFSQLLVPLKGITSSLSSIQRGVACCDRIYNVIDTPVRIVKSENPKDLQSFEKNIEFKNVSFAYKETEVLKNINLNIEKGKMYALVGASGAGKSTMTDLIPRFYDVTSGAILLDDIDIREYQPRHLMNQLAIVTQESILFNDTVHNNIAFGLDNVSRRDVEQAAKIANAHEFIKDLEEGYDTYIGDRGGRLSGGQRQRIAIARAVLKNPPIMILDEATSALDTESERLVQEALDKLMSNRTAIVVAHRLSTIRNANSIVVMDQGQIVEQGTHAELMQKDKGIYKHLVELQSFK